MSEVLFLMLAAASLGEAEPAADEIVLAQMSIERRVIIRVPLNAPRVRAPIPLAPPVVVQERKGPKCIDMDSVRGAMPGDRNSIDLVLENRQRIRAKLERKCRATDFYSSFYMEPTQDGRICADRDLIKARSGTACEIEAFRRLVPEK